MMNHMLSSAALSAVLCVAPAIAAAGELDRGLVEVLRDARSNEIVSTIIFLRDQGDIDLLNAALKAERAPRGQRNEELVRTLRDTAALRQPGFTRRLDRLQARGRIERYEPYWLVNAVRVDATTAVIKQLVQHPDVKRAYFNLPVESITMIEEEQADHVRSEMATGTASSVPPGLAAIRAPEAWELGYTGEGALVASLDTGVSGNHPALGSRWRGHHPGYQGNPQWAWFDPVTNTTSPQEFVSSSHGTHTMGTIVGGAPGEAIGVAPGAEWIHAAVIDRVDLQTTIADLIAAFQWIVDPDGDPGTQWDVPHVCSNSWGLRTSHGYPECDELFWSFIDNAEAAGVLMLFAAGNEGSSGLRRPADRATDDFRNLAVGAINPHIDWFPFASFSSRGPTTCTPDGSEAIKPDITAPGRDIRSAVAGGGYELRTGTSMAAPHVAGVVALMVEACPHLPVNEVKQILYETAIDLGTPGKNNEYGWGMVDAKAAVLAAEAACNFAITLPGGAPDLIVPNMPIDIVVTIIEASEVLLPGSVTLHYRTNGGTFTTVPLTHLGGTEYLATLPAMQCDDVPEYYISAIGNDGTIRTHPAAAPDELHTAAVGVVEHDPMIDYSFAHGLPSGWVTNGMWNITSQCAVEGDCAGENWAYFGDPESCTYESENNAAGGSMFSAPIALPSLGKGERIELSFCHALETDADFGNDRARLLINGAPVMEFRDSPQWMTFAHDITEYAGQTVTLEWKFENVHGVASNARGWQVDRVSIALQHVVCDDAEPSCPADFNGDGAVDALDMLQLMSAWGACADGDALCPADLNRDGLVDAIDLLILLSAWGQCPQ